MERARAVGYECQRTFVGYDRRTDDCDDRKPSGVIADRRSSTYLVETSRDRQRPFQGGHDKSQPARNTHLVVLGLVATGANTNLVTTNLVQPLWGACHSPCKELKGEEKGICELPEQKFGCLPWKLRR